jgi:hypothetical protein
MKHPYAAAACVAVAVTPIATAQPQAVRDPTVEVVQRAVRAALGYCAGDEAFDPRWDLNEDGCINALDVGLAGGTRSMALHAPGAAGAPIAEVILVDPAVTLTSAGRMVSALLTLHNNQTPLFGYSLAVRAVPVGRAKGTVTVDLALSNFYPRRHLILADPAGAPLDETFSVILPWGETGVFVNANTADGSTVQATPEVNDVLAQVFFEVSTDAAGLFELELGPATALSDGDGFAVDYRFCGGRVAVDQPAPLPADLNQDGTVDVNDLVLLILHWGLCPAGRCVGDVNCDGAVNVDDLVGLILTWG